MKDGEREQRETENGETGMEEENGRKWERKVKKEWEGKGTERNGREGKGREWNGREGKGREGANTSITKR